MKKIMLFLLMLLSIASMGRAKEGLAGVKIGTVINIEYKPASKSEKVIEEWVNHNRVIRKIIEKNDEEFEVTVKFDDGNTEIFYYEVDGFSLHIGDKLEIGPDFYDD